MEFKKITLTLPENLVKESQKLLDRGYFANMSDLVRAGIRDEIMRFEPSAEKELNWKEALNQLRTEIERHDEVKKDEEDVIRSVKKTRKGIYARKHGKNENRSRQ